MIEKIQQKDVPKIYRLELWGLHQIHNAESPSLWIRPDFTNQAPRHKNRPPFGAGDVADALEHLILWLRGDSIFQGNAEGSTQSKSESDPHS